MTALLFFLPVAALLLAAVAMEWAGERQAPRKTVEPNGLGKSNGGSEE